MPKKRGSRKGATSPSATFRNILRDAPPARAMTKEEKRQEAEKGRRTTMGTRRG